MVIFFCYLSLNPNKAKVAWSEVCTLKSEGGLGLKSIEEANKVAILKLIWRILSAKSSLWVDWVKRHLIRRGSFWAAKENTNRGSWMWSKILKYRDMARNFHRVEVNNGENTYFWFDSWSSLGCLHEKIGARGCIDLGIPIHSTMSEVMNMVRKRKHRIPLLNQIEEEVLRKKQNRDLALTDVALWKGKNDKYKKKFHSKETWLQIRTAQTLWEGHKEIWFQYATPRFGFVTWLVVKNRVATGERMIKWNQNVNTSCVFCHAPMETREHLFFSCPYAKRVWEELMRGLLLDKFTVTWAEVLKLLSDSDLDRVTSFITKYVFQNAIHSIWCERNDRRHGQQPNPEEKLVKIIDKNLRNRLSTINRGGNSLYAGGLQVWFASRQHPG